MRRRWLAGLVLAALEAQAQPASEGLFFDDFHHTDRVALQAAGWRLRDAPGHPGIPGARWAPEANALLPAEAGGRNEWLQLSAQTDGSADGTSQAQLCHGRKYFEGTTAARVRFRDAPVAGVDGDVVVQTFYLASPLRFDFDPDYSEMDWEYLPNGGWGDTRTRLYAVTWQTVRLDPWQAHNQSDQHFAALDGWHTLVMQAANGRTQYFLDGRPFGSHGGRNYPAVPMALSFNLWFSPGGAPPEANGIRRYTMDVDWVYHARNRIQTPAEIDAAVSRLRAAGTAFRDDVPAAVPALASDCAM